MMVSGRKRLYESPSSCSC